MLDVGTNNADLLKDPEYLGWCHERITGQAYFDFVDQFVQAVKQELPGTYLAMGRDRCRTRYNGNGCNFPDSYKQRLWPALNDSAFTLSLSSKSSLAGPGNGSARCRGYQKVRASRNADIDEAGPPQCPRDFSLGLKRLVPPSQRELTLAEMEQDAVETDVCKEDLSFIVAGFR